MKLQVAVRAQAAIKAMEAFPEVMARHLHGATLRGAHEVAREEKLILAENRSMARSITANAIRVIEVGLMHHRVVAGTNNARMLEEGTGPAAGRKAYMPNPVKLRDYVKQPSGIRWAGKPGSAARRKSMDDVRDRAWALAVHIRKHGTLPHPFAAPALERKTPRIRELVALASIAGIREAFYS